MKNKEIISNTEPGLEDHPCHECHFNDCSECELMKGIVSNAAPPIPGPIEYFGIGNMALNATGKTFDQQDPVNDKTKQMRHERALKGGLALKAKKERRKKKKGDKPAFGYNKDGEPVVIESIIVPIASEQDQIRWSYRVYKIINEPGFSKKNLIAHWKKHLDEDSTGSTWFYSTINMIGLLMAVNNYRTILFDNDLDWNECLNLFDAYDRRKENDEAKQR